VGRSYVECGSTSSLRVNTVLGPVKPEDLGVTLTHEHIFIDLRFDGTGVDGVLDDVDLAVAELRRFKESGGGAVVDVSNKSLGRNAGGLVRVAKETGLHVIASTGYYRAVYYPPHVNELTINKLAEVMLDELTKGIDGTQACAGIIGELATGRDFITPAEERVFRAAARAHKKTGAPLSTHTWLETLAQDQLDLFEDEGVDLQHVIVGHMGDLAHLDNVRAVLARGAYVQFDHVGMEHFQRDKQRVKNVVQLVDEGFASRLLLSQDVCYKHLLHWYDGPGYDHLLTTFVPALRTAGVSEADLNTILVANPRRILAYDV
jgi:predicted metal-dependent phosphotriesterase family hydrolase